jgi:antitoxin CcdA
MRMKKGLSDPQKPFRQERKPVSKRSVNLSIDADVLAAAKAQRINLSQTLEDELRKRTKDARETKWREENREAFESYNRFIAEHGIWSEKYRSWGKR